MQKYKVPRAIRGFIKTEIKEYPENKKEYCILVKSGNIETTRDMIKVKSRLDSIERVFNSLDEQERKEAELIFFSHYTREGLEVAHGITTRVYFRLKNKIIYLVAREYGLI